MPEQQDCEIRPTLFRVSMYASVARASSGNSEYTGITSAFFRNMVIKIKHEDAPACSRQRIPLTSFYCPLGSGK